MPQFNLITSRLNSTPEACVPNAQKTPLALIILDGFGYRAEREGNAIAQAEMPFYANCSKNIRTLCCKLRANVLACPTA